MIGDALARADHFTAKGRATRDRILRSAADIILADGLAGLSMDKVRLRAMVSGSQLTHYFDDKPSLVRAALDRQIDSIMAIHRQPSVGDLSTWDEWECWIEVNVRAVRQFGESGGRTFHGLAGQLAKTDDGTRGAVAEGYRRWIGFFEDRLDHMRSSGVLEPAADPHLLAVMVVGAHRGGCLLSFAYRQAWPLGHAARFIVNHLRTFATDPVERASRPPRRTRDLRRNSVAPAPVTIPEQLTRKGQVTRARIVLGAADLMFEHGVGGTSFDDIRTTLGVSGSQLSHYFADRTDLIRKVIAARSVGFGEFLDQPALGGLASVQSVRAWAEACIADIPSVYLVGGCRFGSLVDELVDADRAVIDDLVTG